jgi:hypothetical protein
VAILAGGYPWAKDFPMTSSNKQKINTRSSTETELVGADDFMPAMCWTRYFLASQGYHVRDNIFFSRQEERDSFGKNW